MSPMYVTSPRPLWSRRRDLTYGSLVPGPSRASANLHIRSRRTADGYVRVHAHPAESVRGITQLVTNWRGDVHHAPRYPLSQRSCASLLSKAGRRLHGVQAEDLLPRYLVRRGFVRSRGRS